MAKKLSEANGIKFAGAVNNNMSFVMVRPGQNAQMAISELAPGLNGRDGVDGKDGEPGAPGRDGADGRDGVDGKDGEPGTPGRDGADGRDGVDGADGAPGRDGVDGAPGRDGADGRDGIDGADGAPGSITNETYSTTEVDTGKTWINGKPIYRVAFSVNITAAANTQHQAIIISNTPVENIINSGGSWRYGNGTNELGIDTYYNAPSDGPYHSGVWKNSPTTVLLLTRSVSARTNLPANGFVEYTKA